MIRFTKAVATGNDFVVVDNRKKVLKNNLARLAKELCDRKYGIGADGLLLLEDPIRPTLRCVYSTPTAAKRRCAATVRAA